MNCTSMNGTGVEGVALIGAPGHVTRCLYGQSGPSLCPMLLENCFRPTMDLNWVCGYG